MRYENFENYSEFKNYLRKNKTTIEKFFLENHNKKDPVSDKSIPFKSIDQYLSQDFLNKKHIPIWLKSIDLIEAQNYIVKKILQRKEKKHWVKFPTQIELRCVQTIPSLNHIELYGDFKYFSEKTDLELSYDYSSELEYNENRDIKVLCDTREQNPLEIKDRISCKLNYGDYTCTGDDYCGIFVERKSLLDLIGTIGNDEGYKRFKKELCRAKKEDCYIVVLVEESFSKFQGYDRTYLNRFTKTTPEFLGSRIGELMQNNDNIQFLFVKNRAESIDFIYKIFSLKEKVRDIDLQYFYDTKRI
jgi:hypothetical protein